MVVGKKYSTILLLLVVFFSASLLLLSVPRFIAGVELVRGDYVLQELRGRQDVSRQELVRLLETRQFSIRWFKSSEAWSELAFVSLVFVEKFSHDQNQMKSALSYLGRSLELSPVKPYDWLRSAIVSQSLGFSEIEVAKALENSIITGPNEPLIVIPRLKLAFLTFDSLNHRQNALLEQQILFAARARPKRLSAMAREIGVKVAIQEALVSYPNLLNRFYRFYDAQ